MISLAKKTLCYLSALAWLGFGQAPAMAQDLDQCANIPVVATNTKGYSECVVECYSKQCGADGLGCPTTRDKNVMKIKCRGKCREMMRRQHDLRRTISFCKRLRVERERARRYRNMIILRHNMWMAKRRLVQRFRMQYEEAKRRRQAAAAYAYYRRMTKAHDQQMEYMRQKLAMKANFYLARSKIRHRQRMELIHQLATAKKRMIQAKAKGDTARMNALRKVILARKTKVVVAEKKEKKLKVDYHKSKVQEVEQNVKQVKVKKKRLQKAKIEAKKKNEQKKLEDLAKQLGELAGKQAALTRKAQIERQKLKKAKVAYASMTHRKL